MVICNFSIERSENRDFESQNLKRGQGHSSRTNTLGRQYSIKDGNFTTHMGFLILSNFKKSRSFWKISYHINFFYYFDSKNQEKANLVDSNQKSEKNLSNFYISRRYIEISVYILHFESSCSYFCKVLKQRVYEKHGQTWKWGFWSYFITDVGEEKNLCHTFLSPYTILFARQS